MLAIGCARYPPRFSPPGFACGSDGGMADFQTTTSGAAPTSPPEQVFRLILRKEYRQAVGTHYGQTRIRQSEFSLCHRRNSRAGTTILQLVSASDDRTKTLLSDYGPARLLEQRQRSRIRRSSRIVLRDYGPEEAASSRRRAVGTTDHRTFPRTTDRPGAADAAVDSAGAAVPFEELRAGRIRRMAMLAYTAASGRHDHATFREQQADESVRCSGLWAKAFTR